MSRPSVAPFLERPEPLDQKSDIDGRLFEKVATVLGGAAAVPDFVKKASETQVSGEPGMDATLYADPGRRLWPVHTAAATWTSAACWYGSDACVSDGDRDRRRAIAARLEKAAVFHGIKREFDKVIEKFAAWRAESPEESIPDEDFALVVPLREGRYRRCPVRNPHETTKAAEWFETTRDSMPWELRRDFARKILEKADEFGMRLPVEKRASLECTAGHGVCSAREAAEAILERVAIARSIGSGVPIDTAIALTELARTCTVKTASARAPESLDRLCAVLDRFDREYGLAAYGKLWRRPEEILFGVTKAAADSVAAETVETTTGRIYRRTDLERLRTSRVAELLGEDVADAMSHDGVHVDGEKAASVVRTLPRPDAALFDKVCRENGVEELAKSAAAHEISLPTDLVARAVRDLEGKGSFLR